VPTRQPPGRQQPKPLPNIFIPQVSVRADKFGHHLNALGIVEDDELDAMPKRDASQSPLSSTVFDRPY